MTALLTACLLSRLCVIPVANDNITVQKTTPTKSQQELEILKDDYRNSGKL